MASWAWPQVLVGLGGRFEDDDVPALLVTGTVPTMVGRYRFGIGQGFIQGIHQVTGPWVRAFLPRSRRGGRCGLTTLRWGRGRVFAPVATTTLTGRVGGQHHTRMKHTRRRGACPHRGDRASFRYPGHGRVGARGAGPGSPPGTRLRATQAGNAWAR